MALPTQQVDTFFGCIIIQFCLSVNVTALFMIAGY